MHISRAFFGNEFLINSDCNNAILRYFFSCKLYSIQFLNAKMAFFKLFGIIENSKDADICICLVKQIACSISTPY